MVDTHAHLQLCDEDDDEVIAAARAAGVNRILTIGLGEESNPAAIAVAEEHEAVFAAVGRHPNGATGFDDAAAAEIEELANHPRVRAVGETGLDYYRDRASREDQRRAFEAQLEIARRRDLPLVIHMRDSTSDTFELLARHADGVTIVLHCFSAPERVDDAVERGWYCSFAGNLTYPNADPLREAAARVSEELLLVETDSPFLAPQPHRGRPNRPANVVATAERLAEVRRVPYAELEELIEENAARAFRW
jgi:TatD DNase family protein